MSLVNVNQINPWSYSFSLSILDLTGKPSKFKKMSKTCIVKRVEWSLIKIAEDLNQETFPIFIFENKEQYMCAMST
jgi:hypothetical protein